MVGLCALMLDSQPVATIRSHQFEACVDKYREMRSRNFLVRASLVYLFAMKAKGWFLESAAVCLKATTVEESDILSALWLEQAANSFAMNKPPMNRKFAFHMLLAGHRYGKCGEVCPH